jgi:hypothetical protein
MVLSSVAAGAGLPFSEESSHEGVTSSGRVHQFLHSNLPLNITLAIYKTHLNQKSVLMNNSHRFFRRHLTSFWWVEEGLFKIQNVRSTCW